MVKRSGKFVSSLNKKKATASDGPLRKYGHKFFMISGEKKNGEKRFVLDGKTPT